MTTRHAVRESGKKSAGVWSLLCACFSATRAAAWEVLQNREVTRSQGAAPRGIWAWISSTGAPEARFMWSDCEGLRSAISSVVNSRNSVNNQVVRQFESQARKSVMVFGVKSPLLAKDARNGAPQIKPKFQSPRSNLSLSPSSIQMKAYLHADQDTYRVPILHGRVKTPLLDSFDRPCVQSES